MAIRIFPAPLPLPSTPRCRGAVVRARLARCADALGAGAFALRGRDVEVAGAVFLGGFADLDEALGDGAGGGDAVGTVGR